MCDCVFGQVCSKYAGKEYTLPCQQENFHKPFPKEPGIYHKETLVASITPQDKTADFVASAITLENKRKIVFAQGRDLNLRDVLEVNVEGSWWRIKTADGKLHLIDPAKVNYASIA